MELFNWGKELLHFSLETKAEEGNGLRKLMQYPITQFPVKRPLNVCKSACCLALKKEDNEGFGPFGGDGDTIPPSPKIKHTFNMKCFMDLI